MAFTLGDPSFISTTALREYCENGRRMIRPLANELQIASVELREALKEIPGQSAWLMNADSKVRARIVASHLSTAAAGVELACGGLVRTFLSFEKHFIHTTPERSKKVFDLEK